VGRILVITFLGFAAVLLLWGVLRTERGKSHLTVAVVFERHPRATPAQERAVARALEADPIVKKWLFVPGITTFAMGNHMLPANASPDSMIVTVKAPRYAGEIASRVRPLPGVELVRSG